MPLTELWSISNAPALTKIPPLSANRPFGATALARLPVIRLPRIVRGAIQLRMPAPSASLARSDRPDAAPTRLLLTVVRTSVSSPQESIPPPEARANGQEPSGHGGPTGAVADGATRVPLITLSLIVTVAPPVQRFDFTRLPVPACPWFVAQGDADDLVDHGRVLAWTRSLDPAPEVRILHGAEHFFHGRLTELRAILTAWLGARIAQNG